MSDYSPAMRESQAGASRKYNSGPYATTSSAVAAVPSPHRRVMGAVGGNKSGAGYSPYARRVRQQQLDQFDPITHDQSRPNDLNDHDNQLDHDHHDADSTRDDSTTATPTQLVQATPVRRQGLLGAVGRAFGSIFRPSSTSRSTAATILPQSNTIADLRAQLQLDETDPFTGASPRATRSKGQARTTNGSTGLSRSGSSVNLTAATSLGQRSSALSSSASVSALSNHRIAPPAGRSAHSTLMLPPASQKQRAVSPALSSTTSSYRTRSPSPQRAGLASSVSAFTLRGASTDGRKVFDAGNGNAPSSSYAESVPVDEFALGLTSRSPFRTTRSASVASMPRSASAGPGSSLFPYASALPRGSHNGTGSASASTSARIGSPASTQKRAYTALTSPGASPRRRVGRSPLNPAYGFSLGEPRSAATTAGFSTAPSIGMDVERPSGDLFSRTRPRSDSPDAEEQRVRKKQLVWDPTSNGLVSRVELEREQARLAPPPPKNEAERILEVLEGLGRTPLGDARRGALASRHIHVPLPVSDVAALTRSASVPHLSSVRTGASSMVSASPYAHRPRAIRSKNLGAASSNGAGLESQLRARDERRRAAIERERRDIAQGHRYERQDQEEDDEMDQDEDLETEKERERQRLQSRRARRSTRRGQQERSEDEDSHEDQGRKQRVASGAGQRRSTRSNAKSTRPVQDGTTSGGKNSRTPKKATAPTPLSTRRTTRASAKRLEREEDDEGEVDQESAADDRTVKSPRAHLSPQPAARARSSRSQRSVSPAAAPPPAPAPASKRIRSPSPSPPSPPATTEPAAPAPTPSFPPPAQPQQQQRSSLRPGKSHTSRQHTASSKVFSFSAREEDLPPVDESALGKISLPAITFPAGGITFGSAASTGEKSATAVVKPLKLDFGASASSEKKQGNDSDKSSSGGLLGRLGAPPASTTTTAPPTFSFSSDSAATLKSATNDSTPAFSFANAPKPATSTAPADFFAKPSTSPAASTPATATSATNLFASIPTPNPPSSSGSKPNFFGSVLENKSTSASTPAVPAPSTFPKIALPDVKKDGSSVPPTSETSAPVSNPFAAIGKPVSEILKEAQDGSKEKSAAPSTASPMFGGFGASASSSSPTTTGVFGASKSIDEKEADAAAAPSLFSTKPAAMPAASVTNASPFSFGTSASTSTSTTTASKDKPSPFSFGAAAPVSASGAQPAVSAPFSFGATTTSATSSGKPGLFSFGAPATPVAVPPIEDADEDSGMEDGGADDNATTAAAAKPALAPFSFSVNSPSGTSSTPAFGASASSNRTAPASTGFTFGQPTATAPNKEASPAPSPFTFGAQPSASGAASPVPSFGAGTASPFGGFSPSPSPGPQSPATSAPAFSFGAAPPAVSAAPAASNPFSFGSAAAPAFGSTNPSPFGSSTTPGASSTGFSFGAPSSAAPVFGSALGAPAMAQTMSAPGGGTASPFGTTTPNGSATGFNFGAPAAAAGSTTPGGSPFQFGAATSSTPFAGFGAGATTGGPAFGASLPGTPTGATTPGGTAVAGGGLFNIGAGGDESPNKRKIAPLRRVRK